MPDAVSISALTGPALEFVSAPRFGTIATVNQDGTPHQAVVWYAVLDDGDVLVNSRAGRRWPTNLLREPRASLLVQDEYRWVSIRGEVAVEDDPDTAQGDIARLARLYKPADEAEIMIQNTFRGQSRISFVLKPRAVSVHL